jgi:hypothetical protein
VYVFGNLENLVHKIWMKMKNRILTVMRWSHLYTGLLLWPWMAIYAISGLYLNHHNWIREHFPSVDPDYKFVREVTLDANESFGAGVAGQAESILARIGLKGPYRIAPRSQNLVIMRQSAGGDYLVKWEKEDHRVTIERKPFSFLNFVNYLHFLRGNSSSYAATIAWGAAVDAVTISTIIWIISGLYLWMKMPRTRLAGGLCVAVAIAVFAVMVALLWN